MSETRWLRLSIEFGKPVGWHEVEPADVDCATWEEFDAMDEEARDARVRVLTYCMIHNSPITGELCKTKRTRRRR